MSMSIQRGQVSTAETGNSSSLRWEIAPDRQAPGAWRVEAQDYRDSDGIVDADGRSYITIFAGQKARERAVEYFEWKARQ